VTHTDEEIGRQPQTWLRAAQLPALAAGLPAPGERVAVVGCGTSWFVAEAYAGLREGAGAGETDHFAASEVPAGRRYDRLLAITRSGTTTEVLDLLRRHRERTPDVPVTVVTADADAPVAGLADHVVALEFADERSVVQTVFPTTVLAALRSQLGHDVAALAAAAERVLAEPLEPEWLAAGQLTFLGRGWTHGIAREAALKLREACQAWTEAYPAMEYRHGPISIAGPGRVVWYLGAGGAGLRPDVEATGATFVDHEEDAQVDLVRIHRLAVAVAVARGLDPDRPRHLTRSVVLPAGGSR
jgi:fructoselysine-6-P-deglycase FrlB-like protein